MRIVILTVLFVLGIAYYLLIPLAMPTANAEGGYDLLTAVETGDLASIRKAHRQGANLQAEISGGTLLMKAVASDQLRTVRGLIEPGVDVNRPASSGWTPLMTAVMYRRHEVVRVLLEAGARTDLQNAAGVGPMEVARQMEDEAMLKMLGNGTL